MTTLKGLPSISGANWPITKLTSRVRAARARLPVFRPVSSDGRLSVMSSLAVAAILAAGWSGGVQAAEAFRLLGTVHLTPGEEGPSHAVFETDDGRQMIIDRGQVVDGCRLADVHENHVVMACSGGAVTLMLRSGLRPCRDYPGSPAAVYRVTLPRAAFEANGGDAEGANQLALEPAVRDGLQYGYRVAWLERGGRFYRLGLRAEDVIVALNDVPTGLPGPFMQAMAMLPGSEGFRVTVERSGELIDYRYLFD
jgi:type II secretion system protein C